MVVSGLRVVFGAGRGCICRHFAVANRQRLPKMLAVRGMQSFNRPAKPQSQKVWTAIFTRLLWMVTILFLIAHSSWKGCGKEESLALKV